MERLTRIKNEKKTNEQTNKNACRRNTKSVESDTCIRMIMYTICAQLRIYHKDPGSDTILMPNMLEQKTVEIEESEKSVEFWWYFSRKSPRFAELAFIRQTFEYVRKQI